MQPLKQPTDPAEHCCRESMRAAELADVTNTAASGAAIDAKGSFAPVSHNGAAWDVQRSIPWDHKQRAQDISASHSAHAEHKPRSRFDWDSLIAALRKCASPHSLSACSHLRRGKRLACTPGRFACFAWPMRHPCMRAQVHCRGRRCDGLCRTAGPRANCRLTVVVCAAPFQACPSQRAPSQADCSQPAWRLGSYVLSSS